MGQTHIQIDGRQTITLHLLLDTASVIIQHLILQWGPEMERH